MMEKQCKKCQKVLPEDYKYKYCEHCRNERNDKFKKIGGTALSLCAVFVAVASGGKFKTKD